MKRGSAAEIGGEPKRAKSLFPLDQNRRYLGAYIKDGYLHKRFELTSPTDPNDKIEIEYVTNDTTASRPKTPSLYPLDQHRKLVREHTDEQGYTHRLTSPSDPNDKIEIEYVTNIPHYEKAEQNKSFVSELVRDDGLTHQYHTEDETVDELELIVKDTEHPSREKTKLEEQQNVLRTRVVGRISLSPNFRDLLHNTKALEISERTKNLVSVGKESSIGEAFTKLIDNDILCIPLLEDDHTFYGFIDMIDVLALLCSKIHTESDVLSSREQWETWHSLQELSELPCVATVNYSGRNPKVEVKSDVNLQAVMDTISSHQLHRLGVISPTGKMETILTQFQVLRFLHKHGIRNEMGNLASMPINQLLLGYRDVLTIPESMRSLEAFRTLIEHKVSGAGIVDEDGKLIGNLSASDLKDIGYNHMLFGKLFIPVAEFMKQKLDGESLPPPLEVTPTQTFSEVLEMFCLYRVHRLYIRDGDHLLGVISPLDIIECFRTYNRH